MSADDGPGSTVLKQVQPPMLMLLARMEEGGGEEIRGRLAFEGGMTDWSEGNTLIIVDERHDSYQLFTSAIWRSNDRGVPASG